jgi:carnitine O-acetyltransferase
MGVSLEHTTYTISPQPPSSASPVHCHIRTSAQSSLDSHLHTIRGTAQNVSNRFYDKTFTLIVDPSTRAGASGEHSPVDALVPSIVAEYGIVQGVDVDAFHTRAPEPNGVDGLGWDRVDWVVDDKIWKECNMATNRANAIIEDSDDSVLWFEKFGTDAIRMSSFSIVVELYQHLSWNRQLQAFS